MICEELTYEKYGYYPRDLSPQSHKPILARCDGEDCGKVRITSKDQYRVLCKTCANVKRFEDPLEREKNSKAGIKRFEDPLEREKTSKAGLKRFEDPLEHEKSSKAHKKYYEDPLAHEKTSKAQIKRWEDLLEREKMSEKIKNSKVHQKQIGGNDIVQHHVIYDHDNPEKFTIPLTRSAHTRMHAALRRHGFKIPHIHVK